MATTEARLAKIEARMEFLQRLLEERLPEIPETKNKKQGWEAIVGTFANDPCYDEAMRLGRQWRDSQRLEADETV